MPSIPQSLLWISLVVLWLFVLVPMLISKRDAVRRTSDVALAARVLTSGKAVRLLRRSGPAAGHRSDPDWRPSDERAVALATTTTTTTTVVDAEPDYLDVEVVEENIDALPAGTPEAPDSVDDLEEDPHKDEIDPKDNSASHAGRRRHEPSAHEPSAHESNTAAAVSARRYQFRKRMLASLGLVLAISVLAAALGVSWAWWPCGLVGVTIVLYLAYLRRQTRIEEQVRRRRAQRTARSRLVENSSSRLDPPRAVALDVDDEDPIFEHLEDASSTHHSGLPHAVGQ